MIVRKSLVFVAAVAISSLLTSARAVAGPVITFPDKMTPNLVWTDIEESNNSIISGQTLFGGVMASGVNDILTLQSTAFSVSNVAAPVSYLTSNLDATINAKPGYKITGIRVAENGRASTYGANSVAYVNLDVSVVSNNGLTLQQDDADYTKLGALGPPSSAMWNLGVSFSFAASDQVLISLRNDLLADGAAGMASIGKDKVQIFVTTAVIPEPTSTLAIIGLGVAGTLIRRRRTAC
jgi:hypothetical protein